MWGRLASVGNLALLALCIFQPLNAAEIERVEPPFWWVGFEHDELQILVYGEDIGTFTPSLSYAGVSINRVDHVTSPNYLFLYLDVDATAKPGKIDIAFENDTAKLSYTFELKEKNPDLAYTRGFSGEDAVYLITPDRFANGDPANDTIVELGDPADRNGTDSRHGGDLAGIEQHLDYIADTGFTAIWLNPVLENAMPKTSYHGYSTTDFYNVDARHGGNEQYRALAESARSKDIGVIMDMIVNHIGIGHWWMSDVPTPDWLNYADVYTQTNHASATNQDPYASEFDKEILSGGWYDPTMPDLNQRNPLLADYLIQNTIWWIEYIGLAGIRMDTYRYPDQQFMSEWSRRVTQEYPEFNITGEDTSINPAVVAYWQRGNNNRDGYVSSVPSMLDFPLYEVFAESLIADVPWWASVWSPVYDLLGGDFVYPDPYNLVIFPDNHDRSRVFTQLDEDYDLYRIAMVFYLTMRGIPQIYYGTEILMTNPGTDAHGIIRSDFPGGWPGDEKNAFTGAKLTEIEREAQEFMRTLLNWRKGKPVIHTGRLMQFTPIKNVYAYFRYDDSDTVMVVFNRGEESVSLDTARFKERLGDSNFAEEVLSGKRYNIGTTIRLEPMSVMILEIE